MLVRISYFSIEEDKERELRRKKYLRDFLFLSLLAAAANKRRRTINSKKEEKR